MRSGSKCCVSEVNKCMGFGCLESLKILSSHFRRVDISQTHLVCKVHFSSPPFLTVKTIVPHIIFSKAKGCFIFAIVFHIIKCSL